MAHWATSSVLIRHIFAAWLVGMCSSLVIRSREQHIRDGFTSLQTSYCHFCLNPVSDTWCWSAMFTIQHFWWCRFSSTCGSLGVSCTIYTQCYRILLLKYGAVEINLHLFIYFMTLQSSVTNPNSRGMKCVKKQGWVSVRGTALCPRPVLSSGGWRWCYSCLLASFYTL